MAGFGVAAVRQESAQVAREGVQGCTNSREAIQVVAEAQHVSKNKGTEGRYVSG